MILLIDNYDSFTYNLAQMLESLAPASELRVVRNDALPLPDLQALNPAAVIISPGPGGPPQAGVSLAAVRAFADQCPLLGVCLGHQCIIEAFGGRIGSAGRLMHGKTSLVHHECRGLFAGLPSPMRTARYHSLSADPDALPATLRPIAHSEDGEVMAVEHRSAAVWGVQFHPESFLTPQGERLMINFVRLAHVGPSPA